MSLSAKAKKLVSDIGGTDVKLGDIKKHGKQIKKDHDLAIELWSTGKFHPRLLTTLILDKKQLSQEVIDRLASDMQGHDEEERTQLADWLLANQLMKDRATIGLMLSWQENPSPILRRLFWYYQARLRWTGQVPPDNSVALLNSLEKDMAGAEPDVQWAMNFCACQIGVHEPEFRNRCIKLGKKLKLYKGDPVSRNCTPSYLPDFLEIEVAKRER